MPPLEGVACRRSLAQAKSAFGRLHDGLSSASQCSLYGVTVPAVRVLVVFLVAVAATSATARGAATEYDPWSTLRYATGAEKRATRPLAEAVVAAYRSGNFAALCGLFSPAHVDRVYGSPSRCRQTLRRTKHPCSDRCTYRAWGAMTAYQTRRDKELDRPTLAWLYTVRDPRRSGGGEIDIRMRKAQGRWYLVSDIVESWTG